MNLWDLVILAVIGLMVWGAFTAIRKGGKRCSGCCEACGTADCHCKTAGKSAGDAAPEEKP